MKKKLLLSVITLFIAAIFVINANAVTLNVPNTTAAKAPDAIPANNTVLYGTVSDEFDFSKIQFEGRNGDTIQGKKDLKKIFLGSLNLPEELPVRPGLNDVFENWFSAYCLDGTKKYPEHGIYTVGDVEDDDFTVENIVMAALVNDESIQDVIKRKVNTKVYTTGIDYDIPAGETLTSIINKVKSMNTDITINVNELSFCTAVNTSHVCTNEIKITGSELAKDTNATTYALTFKGKDVIFDKYNVTNKNNVTGYDHALWIIEHSYPTLPIRTALKEAGADYDTLVTQLKAIDNSITDANVESYVENYVFGTVQYAVWKSTGYEVNGKELGNSVKNVEELDKLYKYLIKNRSEYTGYSTRTFANKITVSQPQEGKELFKETTKTYVYGPFSATYDVLAGGDMSIEITNTESSGISIVDINGEKLTKVSYGQEFYIETLKTVSVGSISAKLSLAEAAMFKPQTDRGRIYYPFYTLGQNVMSGGKIVNEPINTTFNFTVNSKTGVENVALLLMVTLVAFTLGYLVLSYKTKPVNLQ